MKRLYVTLVILFGATWGMGTPYAQTDTSGAAGDTSEVQPAPVVVGNATVFTYTQRLGPLSPQERAQRLHALLDRLVRDPSADPARIVARDRGTETDIALEGRVLMTLTEADAQGGSRSALAEQVAGTLRRALRQEAERYTARSLFIGAGLAVAFTLVFVLFLKFAKRGFRKVYARLETWRGKEGAALSLQGIELLSRDILIDLAPGVFNLVRLGVYALATYAYAAAAFGLFPWTQTWARTMVGYVLTPAKAVFYGIVAFLPNLFFIAVIVVVTHYAMRILNYFAALLENRTLELRQLPPDLVRPTRQIAKFLLFVLALVVVTPYLPGAGSAAAKNLTIFFGVLISLGSTSLVGNLLSGFVLTYMRVFQIGDRVRVADTVGDVIGRSLLAVKVRTIKNEDIFIPNQTVANNHLINYSAASQEHGLILHTTVTIGYDVPWRKVHDLLIVAARGTSNILEQPAPFVLQTSLDDFYVSYQINAYTDRPHFASRIYSELHQNIQDRFNEGGVEIMSPHYGALRDGNQTTIPENYLPGNYEPPAFRVFPIGNRLADPVDRPAS